MTPHSYMQGALPPPTLQGTLMNYTNIVRVIATRTEMAAQFEAVNSSIPFAITEENSILNIGTPGLSDVFGSALWATDFQLTAAASGVINRMHIQQGGQFVYNSWQPVNFPGFPRATRPAYYGDIFTVTALGDASQHPIQITALSPSTDSFDSSYAVFEDGKLARIVAISFNEYNSTNPASGPRANATYIFDVDTACNGQASISRLMGPGSDAITDITVNGYSYASELNHGKPLKLQNATTDEPLTVSNSEVVLYVPYASAAIVNLCC